MLSLYQTKRLSALISRHVAAEIDNSWSGAADPVDLPAIESEKRAAKKVLAAYLRSVTAIPSQKPNEPL